MRPVLAAISCLLASASATSAQRIVLYQTKPGGGLIIGSSFLDPQCRPIVPMPTFVASRPQHGRITIWRGTDMERTHPNPACNFRQVPAVFFRYTAAPGFVGRDHFSFGCRQWPPSDCFPITIIVDMVP